MVDLVNRIGLEGAPSACATVGMLDVYPNSRNVIPGRVNFTVDFRHPDEEVLDSLERKLYSGIEQIAAALSLETQAERIFCYAPVHFDDECISIVRQATESLGYSHRDMISGAGHDACYLSKVAPTSMIFVPCIGGISHNEIEDAKPEWITAGANVLLRAVLEKAGRPA